MARRSPKMDLALLLKRGGRLAPPATIYSNEIFRRSWKKDGLGGRSRLSGDVSGVRRDVPRRCCIHKLLVAVALAYRLRLLGLRIV